jgi:hypothetical protein
MEPNMKSQNGIAQSGKDFDPSDLPDQPEDTSHIRPAPAPGLPISEEEYKRLKEEAENVKPPRPVKDKRKVSRRKTKDGKHR